MRRAFAAACCAALRSSRGAYLLELGTARGPMATLEHDRRLVLADEVRDHIVTDESGVPEIGEEVVPIGARDVFVIRPPNAFRSSSARGISVSRSLLTMLAIRRWRARSRIACSISCGVPVNSA